MKQSRILFIDFFKALLIITIVLAHINYANHSIRPWMNSFNIPAFFFASGLLLKKITSKREFANAISKKFQSLMIPYYLWGVIYIALTIPNLICIFYASYNSLEKCGSLTPLWFLPVLFLSVVFYLTLAYLLKDRFTSRLKLAIMMICFIATPFFPRIKIGYPMSMNVAVCAFGFLLLGNVCFPLLKKCEAYITSPNGITGYALSVIIMALCGVGGYLCASFNGVYVKAVLMADARYGHFGLFMLGALLGISFTFFAATFLEKLHLEYLGRVLRYLGQNTFSIYVLHKPVVVLMKSFLYKRFPNWIVLIITCTAAIAVSLFGNVLLNRFVPILLGRPAKQEK